MYACVHMQKKRDVECEIFFLLRGRQAAIITGADEWRMGNGAISGLCQ